MHQVLYHSKVDWGEGVKHKPNQMDYNNLHPRFGGQINDHVNWLHVVKRLASIRIVGAMRTTLPEALKILLNLPSLLLPIFPTIMGKWQNGKIKNGLEVRNRLTVYRVPGHLVITGNEKVDNCASHVSSTPYIGPEPALLIPKLLIWTKSGNVSINKIIKATAKHHILNENVFLLGRCSENWKKTFNNGPAQTSTRQQECWNEYHERMSKNTISLYERSVN